jgi:hypothetical protein
LSSLFVLSGLLALAACSPQTTALPPAGTLPEYRAPTGAQRLASAAELEGHILAAENGRYEMYLKEETLSILLRDKESGAVLRSTVEEPDTEDNETWKGFYQSGVVMEYIQGTNLNMTRADLVYKNHTKKMYYRPDGFSAELRFPDVGISYTLTVTLTDYGFSAEIPQASIREEDPVYTVGGFYVYPFLGYSRLGEDSGYLFIPDGQGALITLQDNEKRFSQPYMSQIYGANFGMDVNDQGGSFFNGYTTITPAEKILAPVYGAVHIATDDAHGIGFLGIVESGAENASVEAWPNGASTRYDWIAAHFLYRHVYQQPTGMSSGTVRVRTERSNRVDIKLRFALVSGENANYTGLALRYREYLKETNTFRRAALDSYRTEVDFFGTEKKNWALFKLDVNMTSFQQAADILRDLRDHGVKGVFSVYEGWQQGGSMGGLPVSGYTPAGGLGGRSGMTELLNTAAETGALIFPQSDLLRVNPATQPFEAMNAMKRVTGRTITQPLNGWVYSTMHYLSPPRSVALAEKASASFAQAGIPGLALTGTSNSLTAYQAENVYFDRTDNAALYDALTLSYAEKMPLALERSFAYLWQYAAALTRMPLGGSGYLLTSMEVPFLSIALSGCIPVYAEYTNFQANQKEFFLRLVETGARPSFLITTEDPSLLQKTNRNDIYSSRYDLYRDVIVRYDQELRALHEKIGGASITAHQREGNAVIVTYDNGLRLLLNYGDDPAVIEGKMVEPLSYVEAVW